MEFLLLSQFSRNSLIVNIVSSSYYYYILIITYYYTGSDYLTSLNQTLGNVVNFGFNQKFKKKVMFVTFFWVLYNLK